MPDYHNSEYIILCNSTFYFQLQGSLIFAGTVHMLIGSGRGVQHYVIKFVSDLRQVGGFLRVLRFPPPIKLTATK
jgi:hypothetical protein